MDNQGSSIVQGSFLKIHNDKFTTFLKGWKGHISSWSDSQTASHSQMQISNGWMPETQVKILLSQILIEIDDCILKVALAEGICAFSACFMVMNLLSISDSKVTKVLSAAFWTKL